ncbi:MULTISPECIES: hypothetical protein [Brevibacillus]|jgi:hypothetical protein|uniref:Uncharacterized protein n=1 Tax=Brevibacillus parabrevis TaxID=54914 RepID=A0A4Y3PA77_BREPA|nr:MULTISPECIES: hypothetical protein [Brevibacillus]MBU8711813.1 hypothetical protein [Brevibacillus parabrevis]MDH6348883.1 hypothetical protein [Brevibacillus sp. 1238]MDR5000900.1 hypothetical protein [Brevibacillus parabrevis]MED1723895.1 hypothetical protein [Brevibacillus parabrevis]MED2257848.1 hypothetical protein [Brevibacillus parabrevis]
MDIQQHEQLLRLLTDEFASKTASVTFTQWDTDSEEEEEVTQFQGQLTEVKLTDNEFEEKDLLLVFVSEAEGELEILMEIPGDEVDLATFADGKLSIFGTEAEIVLEK